MTTIEMAHPTRHTRSTAEGRLRAVLTANAATSAVAGVAGLVAAGWWSDRRGSDSPGWVRIVSAGLVLFALDVLLVARARPAALHRWSAVVSAADLAWVAGTVAVIAAGGLNGTGVAVAAVVGVGVLDFAALQLWFRSRMAT